MKKCRFFLHRLIVVLPMLLALILAPVPVTARGETFWNTGFQPTPGGTFRECIENSGLLRVGDGSETRPYWFPANTAYASFYNDPYIPRVVDDADIFTDDEEAVMRELIAEISEETQHDIVVYTEANEYHMRRDILAADFYDYNGYGIGENNEGMCLVIGMNPDDRGWWAMATGPDTQNLYNYGKNAEQLDDRLYTFMSAGNYAEGVTDWIRNIRTMYVKGVPFVPDWFPDRDAPAAEITAEEAAALPRIVDDAGLFTAEQAAELTAEAKAISDRYGVDVVIKTDEDDYYLGTSYYSGQFYRAKGYGFGENKDGCILSLFADGTFGFSAYGKAKEKMSDVNYERITGFVEQKMKNGSYYEAAGTWLKHTEHMLRTGRVVKNAHSWAIHAVFSAILGLIGSWFALRRAKNSMVSIRLDTNADAFISGKPVLTKISDIYLRTYETRKTKPKVSSSSSGRRSSSHSSSYTRTYSGSSGRSHSGSGRSF